MHKHTITFEDFNGTTRTKEIYFNLTEAELVKMQKKSARGIHVEMEEAIKSNDNQQILDFFEMLVHESYGIKSDDGMDFDKSPEILRKFENSAYYSPLYMSFFENEGQVGADFINAIMPAKLVAKAEARIRGEEGQTANGNVSQIRPDARELFEQRKSELKDHLPKQNGQNGSQQTPPQQPLPSQQYVPQNQPVYPSVQDSQPVSVEPEAAPAPETPPQMTREQWEEQQRTINRPPHESGPGYTQ